MHSEHCVPDALQQSGVAELSGIPRNLPRAPSSNIVWRMSGEPEVGQLGPTTLLEGGLLAERNLASANPQALRRQSFNLEEPPRPPPRREVRRPPVSAFQQVAVQDCESTHPALLHSMSGVSHLCVRSMPFRAARAPVLAGCRERAQCERGPELGELWPHAQRPHAQRRPGDHHRGGPAAAQALQPV